MDINKIIALTFLGIILVGALLLMLPVSSRDGHARGFLTALFTSTSATCVTGLVLADTYVMWSDFGQAVILCLIEVGGLGFMSFASFGIFLLRRRIKLSQQMVIAQSIGAEDYGDAIRVQKRMIGGCLATEAVGALCLTLRFLQRYNFGTSLKLGVFHSISAFCNAGFDIFGFETEGGSLLPYQTDLPVLLILALLIIMGGLGFLVWDEVLSIRSPKKWSVYTKLVLITTGALIVGGTLLFLLAEWNNDTTIGEMTAPQKILAAFFQSVTLRTAGFSGVDQSALTEGGKALSICFMLIGGSSGSTAGGLKTATFVVMLLALVAGMRGKHHVSVFRRTITQKQILNAFSIFGIMVLLSLFGGIVIALTTPVGFTDALFEAISALATVGLSTGITAGLSVVSKILIIFYMYFGRVGILTISLGFLREKPSVQKYHYAETSLLIG